MKKNFLFKGVSILGAVLLLANAILPGLQVFATSGGDGNFRWDYIGDKTAWDDAYKNGGLKYYYARYPGEDLWDTMTNDRRCGIEDAIKESGEYVLDENGEKTYPDYCVPSWSGHINNLGAENKLPWVVISFSEPVRGIVKFSYSGLDDVYPRGEEFKNWGSDKLFGVASVYEEFGNKEGFLFKHNPFTFDVTNFDATLIPARTLTIHYEYSNGDEAAEDYTGEFLDGADYSVVSPKIGDYTASIATVSGTITADVEVTVTYAKSEMTITATKLATAPDDLNKEDAQANQDAVTITQEGNNIIVKGKLDQLKTYNSTNPNQGEHQWVGIILTTNLESITGAKWNGSQLTQDDIDEGATVGLNSKQIIYWTKVDVIKDTPAEIAITASGYEDVNLTVSFEEKAEEKTNGTSGGGGKGSGGGSSVASSSEDKTNTDSTDNTKASESTQVNEKGDETDGDNKSTDSQNTGEEKYTQEFHDAYDFAFKNGITTMPSIAEADMNGTLTRIAMAKMLSQYAINVLGKTPDTGKNISFPDVSPELDAQYNSGVTLSYQLGIMGIGIDEFRPLDEVTRAEFVTALSRMLFGLTDGENLYYETHMQKLLEEKIITVADPDMQELRGYVMIMLMRSANK